ncbi:MAG: phosphopantothenoylcysteine decarboxylase [Candidatus Omnitrophica bacterium]|nr:phosphopantothenoylcysteine decarboxylase [Candidatus Omnitrophota bacterium]
MAINRLRGKKVLITAGPTWVRLDSVRIISNIATGETGILIARALRRSGAKVKLLLGPFELSSLDKTLTRELKSKVYDIVIHSAAVSDYKSGKAFRGKIRSGIKNLKLTLVPTKKIINTVKKLSPDTRLVGFKFEPNASKAKLINEARMLMRRSSCDLVVANTLGSRGYRALIVDGNKVFGPYSRKTELVSNLTRHL